MNFFYFEMVMNFWLHQNTQVLSSLLLNHDALFTPTSLLSSHHLSFWSRVWSEAPTQATRTISTIQY